jgi:FlaG/FlaF family flagellin (archaellin)
MVGITVVLAAVLYVMVSGMMTSTNITPTVSMIWKENDPGNYSGSVVSISGSSALNLDDVIVVVTHEGETDSNTCEWLVADNNKLVAGDFTLDYVDNNHDAQVGGDDDFIVTGGQKGDIIRLVHAQTNGLMVTQELK